MAGGSEGRSLALTPTWVIAAVCTVFVVVSFAVERAIHRLGLWFKKNKQKAWLQALEKMKEELMLMGFISLFVTVTQQYIVKICLPTHVVKKWTACAPSDAGSGASCSEEAASAARRLLATDAGGGGGAEAAGSCQGTCGAGYQPAISVEGIHQLHIFIFVMAVVHVVYSALAMALSLLKIHMWKKWEVETYAENHDSMAEVTRAITMNRQSTFVRYHTSKPWSQNRFLIWIVCFFRQFFTSVTRADYLALRLGFITNHNLDKKFNFHTYMVRTMEEEFKGIVGISAYLWAFVVCFMLFNIHGTDFYFWIALIPPVMLLTIGAKLQHVIATLALENAQGQSTYAPHKLKPRDELFWMGSPELLLGLIHFILFQNAFELATFFWYWWQFSLSSCFLNHKTYTITRLLFGIFVQIVCSYSTLPLYALVSQMGSSYKLGGHVKGALQGWRKRAQGRLESQGLDSTHGSNQLQGSLSGRYRISTVTEAGKDVELQIPDSPTAKP